jgi:drug/metabolite transporter (DMT)-like permease
MKTVTFSVIAMLLYALTNVLIEQKLSKLNNLTLIVSYTSVILILALIARQIVKTDDVSFNFPTGNLLLIALGVGILFTLADYLFIGAYTNGGNILTVTSIIALFPAVASLFKFLYLKN